MLPILQENQKKLGEYARILPMNQNPAALLEGVPMLRDYLDLVEGVEKKEFWDSIHSPVSYDGIHTAMLCGTGWMDAACNSTIDPPVRCRRSGSWFPPKRMCRGSPGSPPHSRPVRIRGSVHREVPVQCPPCHTQRRQPPPI